MALALHLVDEWCHAVDGGIAAADDHHGAPLAGHLESLLRTVALALHARVDALGIDTQVGLDELEIIFVAHHHIRLADGSHHGRGNILFAARAEAYNDDFWFLHSYFRFYGHKGNNYI